MLCILHFVINESLSFLAMKKNSLMSLDDNGDLLEDNWKPVVLLQEFLNGYLGV